MNTELINEDRTIWVAIILSALIHALFFAFSGKTFIQNAQFSIRPSALVEVSIEEEKYSKNISPIGDGTIKSIENKNQVKETAHSRSGVKVKASPDYFQNSSPEYPELARQMHQEGLVMLSVNVDKEGDPESVEIIQSSGFRMLDQAALKVVSHWKFQPGSVGGVPVDSMVTVPIRFRLET